MSKARRERVVEAAGTRNLAFIESVLFPKSTSFFIEGNVTRR